MKLHPLPFAAAAVLALAACAGGDDGPPPLVVSDVAVSTDLAAVTSRQSAQFFGNLDSDLESAIAAQFVGQTGADGVGIVVDVDELSLAQFLSAGTDGQLTGDVAVIAPNGETSAVYTVTATASQAATLISAQDGVVTVAPTSTEFYSALVDSFARGVANAVRGSATTG
jgi:hypothetical protein